MRMWVRMQSLALPFLAFFFAYSANLNSRLLGSAPKSYPKSHPKSLYKTNDGGYISLGGTYTQDFNTLATSGPNNPNSGIPAGWQVVKEGTIFPNGFTAGNGSSQTNNTYSFGDNSSTDRALGSITGNNMYTHTLGALFTNTTGTPLRYLALSFVVEQWRKGGDGVIDKLSFFYQANSTDLTSGVWTENSSFRVTTIATAATSGAVLNGNNNSKLVTGIIDLGATIAVGQSFGIKWVDENDPAGNDDGLAIDDVSITPLGSQLVFYDIASATADLQNPNQWTLNADGTLAPFNYTLTSFLPNATYIIKNRNTYLTVSSDWGVGLGSQINIGDGIASKTVDFINTVDGSLATLNVLAGSSVNFKGTITNINVGTLQANSTCIYNNNNSQNILPGTYRNLKLMGTGLKKLIGDVTILNALEVNDGNLDLDTYTLTLMGSYTGADIKGGANASLILAGSGSTALAIPNIINGLKNLTINHTRTGAISLTNNVTVYDNFILTQGTLTATGKIILEANASANFVGGNSSSYVIGAMAHTVSGTNSATRIFALGDANAYRPLILRLTQTEDVATKYTATLTATPQFATDYFNRTTNNLSLLGIRNYTITQTPNTTLSANGNQVAIMYGADDNVINVGQTVIAQWNQTSTNSAWISLGAMCNSCTTNSGTISSVNNITAFGDFALATQAVALPVKWLQFNAKREPGQVQLLWQTASETNNDFFELQRAASAEFTAPQTLAKLKGAGTTTNIQTYHYTDVVALQTTVYYRIKQTDYDGGFDFSAIVEVPGILPENIIADELKIAPNPAYLPLVWANAFECSSCSLKIYDNNGIQMFGANGDKNQLQNELQRWQMQATPGIYTLQVATGVAAKSTRVVIP